MATVTSFQRVTADTAAVNVAITASATSAGAPLSWTGYSSSVTLVNTGTAGFEYSLGGAWKLIPTRGGDVITANLAVSQLKLRLTADGGTAASAEITVTGNLNPEANPTPSALLRGRIGFAQRSRAFKGIVGAEQTVGSGFSTMTWALSVQIDTPYDAIRPILLHSAATTLPGVTFSVASNPNYVGNPSGASLAYVAGTWAGSASGTLAAGTIGRPSVNVPDMMAVPSLARTDGGSGYVAHVRVCLPTAGTIDCSVHSNTNDLTKFKTLDKGMFFSERSLGDYVATPAGFGNTAGRTDTPIWALEFVCRGQVVSMITFGDSLTRGATTTLFPNKNFGEYASLQMSDPATVAFHSANCGWLGQTTAQYLARTQDMLAVLKPTIAVYPAFTPNDHANTAGGITQAAVDAERYRAGQFVELCRANGVIPVLWTGMPAAASKGWNAASDAIRLAYGAELMATYGSVAYVMDFDRIVTNSASPAGVQASLTTDNLHLIDAGQALLGQGMAQSLLAAVRQAILA